MERINYSKLSVLIADDFSNFRKTVNTMLTELGVSDIEMASSGQELIDRCQVRKFNVILCDYNLGEGRNGQHVLEELRFRHLLRNRDVFILISAEASRNIVMSAYDCAPDDYLMKPITTQMLHTRIERVLMQRLVLSPVYHALDNGQIDKACEQLIEMSLAENRYSTAAQKLLGELFVSQNELNKAEKLYKKVLEVRELDWARLGLARVKHLKGEHDLAEEWLEKIIAENYLFLPAYDVLAENCNVQGRKTEAQNVVQRSVEVSPMSILRQKKLAELAINNADFATAVAAMRKTVKLGKLSCYGHASDHISLARAVADACENKIDLPVAVIQEAFDALQSLKDAPGCSDELRARGKLGQGRLLAATGEKEKAKLAVDDAGKELAFDLMDIETALDQVKALQALGEHEKAKALLNALQKRFASDQGALEKLDVFLDEPVSESNKAMVAKVNRDGIELYNNAHFDEALACFEKARVLFPKHVGLQLNIVQALIGKLKGDPVNETARLDCINSLDTVAGRIAPDDNQYRRFMQLKNMAKSLLNQDLNPALTSKYGGS